MLVEAVTAIRTERDPGVKPKAEDEEDDGK